MVIGLEHYLTVAGVLFTLGILGIFLNRKNVIVILMCVELMSSTSTVPRLRKYTTRIARPIAASAAATVSTSMANTWPVTLPW